MSPTLVISIVLLIGIAGFVLGRQRAVSQQAGASEKPHSRVHYHGWWVFLAAVLPALIFMAIWSAVSTTYIDNATRSALPEQTQESAVASRALATGMVQNLARGLRVLGVDNASDAPQTFEELQPRLRERGIAVASDTQDYMIPLALQRNAMEDRSSLLRSVLTIAFSLAGAAYAFSTIGVRARARNKVERVTLLALVAASTIAILTTIGIVFSMLFETIHFFQSVSPANFFFGTVWDPRFAAAGSGGAEGQFGLIPLLAGTLYIAFVAMLFAVPVGLMAAVYMAEYATPGVRSVVKPLLEVLAGIPTIVYGFFALVTVGPFLRDLSADIAGGPSFIQAQSVLTAGLVMGIMLIPFVSSLSDDIITAVPRAMRDGSLGLGATRSETVKRVILPAALPGIVGALLLTASRAIGETMIVVMAAGVAARLTWNPFETMTTITVKIVNQLTGDLEFTSPQTLVAFALGMTLFVLTLAMNVFALYIVRKYREQYE
ncbi:phosphate transport system permease protein [Mesorhizobium sp. J18]|uniref:phosphate ABC transporter permease subunit PstC n=1 Tax=Mesorhizobium sp. J18 TaxID=935263 RepID=UPI00119BAA49|nr:phosphate ABC transporter permease subunit PstC [Mesorhizobium sp. J18]TWG98050.1 phosphate transport system permease protein [Mesorhizobium sp. J18]